MKGGSLNHIEILDMYFEWRILGRLVGCGRLLNLKEPNRPHKQKDATFCLNVDSHKSRAHMVFWRLVTCVPRVAEVPAGLRPILLRGLACKPVQHNAGQVSFM